MKLLFKNALVYAPDTVISNAYVAVDGAYITYVGTARPLGEFDEEKDMSGKLLMPGLVNCHTHTPMTLLRGVGSDLPLQTWLFDKIFPVEGRLTPEMMRIGTELAMLEMLSTGTTSFSDMYFYPDAMVEAIIKSGMKANITQHVQSFDAAGVYADNGQARVMEHLYHTYHGAADGRILVDACLHAEYTNFSDEVASKVADFAKAHDLRTQVHLSETLSEHEECKTRHGGLTPTLWLEKMGMLDVPCTAAHCVWVTPEDIEVFRAHGVTVAHNPTSNMKLGSGFAPIPEIMDAGVNVALGTDGTASNNNLNMFEEMHLAAVIHNGYRHDPSLMKAREVVDIATRRGALAQGRNDCGMLAPGKKADIIAIDTQRPHLVPDLDTASLLTYSVQGSDVVMTMVDGKVLYENGEYLTLDRERIFAEAEKAVAELYQ